MPVLALHFMSASSQAASAGWVDRLPPEVVFCAQLDVRAHDGHLNRDDDCQDADQEQEPKNVVEVPMRHSIRSICRCSSPHFACSG